MPLSAPRSTITRKADDRALGVKANTKIWQGSIVVNDAGVAAPGRTAATLVALGMALETADNTGGAAGDIKASVRRGTFCFKNSASDAVTAASIGKTVYIVDDETVSGTNAGGNTQSVAGVCFDLDSAGVWVTIG
jgi:hypothetical protein